LRKHSVLLILVTLLVLGACGTKPNAPGLSAFAVAVGDDIDISGEALAKAPRYHLRLEVMPRENSLAGDATIYYTNPAPAELREVYLRLYPNMGMYGGQLNIRRVAVDGHDVPYVVGGKNTDLKVPMPRTLPSRGTAVIEVTFSLRYPVMKGEYDFFGARDDVAVLPDFYPMIVPLIDGEWRLDPSPGFGDAAFCDISLYELEVVVPQGYQVFAPGKLIERTKHDASITYHMVSGPARNIGLVIAAGYETQELATGGVTLMSAALPTDRTASRAALAHADGALAYCEDNLGPYPARDLLLVRVPLREATTYLSGMVLVSSRYYGEERASLEHAVVDGVVRQWWGLRVANDPLRDPWVDEGLAAYTTYLYLRQTHGEKDTEGILQSWHAAYESVLKTNLDGPLAQPLGGYGNSARYELLVCHKGPLFWLDIENRFGREGSLLMLREIQTEFAYRFLSTDDLAAALSRLGGLPASSLVESWVFGFQ